MFLFKNSSIYWHMVFYSFFGGHLALSPHLWCMALKSTEWKQYASVNLDLSLEENQQRLLTLFISNVAESGFPDGCFGTRAKIQEIKQLRSCIASHFNDIEQIITAPPVQPFYNRFEKYYGNVKQSYKSLTTSWENIEKKIEDWLNRVTLAKNPGDCLWLQEELLSVHQETIYLVWQSHTDILRYSGKIRQHLLALTNHYTEPFFSSYTYAYLQGEGPYFTLCYQRIMGCLIKFEQCRTERHGAIAAQMAALLIRQLTTQSNPSTTPSPAQQIQILLQRIDTCAQEIEHLQQTLFAFIQNGLLCNDKSELFISDLEKRACEYLDILLNIATILNKLVPLRQQQGRSVRPYGVKPLDLSNISRNDNF
jgi:hypothetical protein